MNEQELLAKVKKGLGITSNYQDDLLIEYIQEVKRYLLDAGVKTSVVNSSASSGVISKGVSDLWNFGSGATNLSPYFLQRVSQLTLVEGNEHSLQSKTATPTTAEQVIKADDGYEGLEQVTVSAVTNAIDDNIQASNIKNGISILGVNGVMVGLEGEERNITPTTAQQEILPSEGKNAITKVNVSAVTSSIDNNIQAENIKSGVSILGVEGTFDKTLGTKTIEHNGTYHASYDNLDGYSEVIVNTGTASLGEKTIVDNGTFEAIDDELDGYSKVIVNVPASTPVLENKTITANGTYHASAGYDGLGEIVVNVQSSADGEVQFIENSSTTTGVNLTVQTNVPDYSLQVTNSTYAYLEEVGFTDGCLEIGNSAFKNQKNMTLTSYPRKATIVREYAFLSCSSIRNIVLESATEIRPSAFVSCTGLLTVNLPKIELLNNTSGNGQFNACSRLTTVRLGNSIRTIGEFTFRNCSAVTAIYIDLPRATVEAMSGYQYAWSRTGVGTNQTLQPSVIICNDDPNWIDG